MRLIRVHLVDCVHTRVDRRTHPREQPHWALQRARALAPSTDIEMAQMKESQPPVRDAPIHPAPRWPRTPSASVPLHHAPTA